MDLVDNGFLTGVDGFSLHALLRVSVDALGWKTNWSKYYNDC